MRRAWRLWALQAALLPGLAGALPVVSAVELRSDVELPDAAELLRSVSVEVGQPLDRENVARSLRNLHAAGVAGQIEAYLLGTEEQPVVAFVLRGRTLVERVEIDGELGLRPSQVRNAVVVGGGEPLLADRVFRSVYQLRELYEAEGYLDASVRVAIDEDEARRRAAITFTVDSGTPAKVGEVRFDGELAPFDPSQLLEPLRGKPAAPYRPRTVRDDRERLESWLLRQGYRQAVVGAPRESRVDSTRVDLAFAVEIGPRFTLEVVGEEKTLRRQDLLPLQDDERFDDGLLEDVAQAIEVYYQSQGHYGVTVDLSEGASETGRHVRLEVVPGAKQTLRELRFVGNEQLTADRLRSVMQTAPRSALSVGTGVVVDDWLAEDLRSLRGLYALDGFSQAEIGPARVLAVDDHLELEIPIVEGRRRMVSGVTLDGVHQFPEEEVVASLPLRPGGPFHPRHEEEALDLLRARYEDAGFGLAQVTSQREVSDDGSLVQVALQVQEGPQHRVERVIVRGQQRTRPQVIRRVLALEPGTPVSQRRLLEVQRRLYGLGIFTRVDVRVIPGTPYSGERDVMVEVREGQRQRLAYGLGYDSDDGARGLLGYGHNNLWGRAISGRVDLRASQRDYQARALLRQPYLGRFRLPVTTSLFDIEQQQESFRSHRRGAQIEIQRPQERSRLSLLYTYKLVEIEDPDTGLEPLLIDRAFADVTIASLTPSLFLDYRDDAIDPQRGWSATLLTELAFPVFAADEEFVKSFLQYARYWPLHRAGVVAVSLRAGAIEPLGSGSTPDPVCESNGLDFPACGVKISERFFAGGRTSHRAYRRDRLGILGETLLEVEGQENAVPFGGTGLLLANLDYRFPLGAGLGGTVFVDGGNVWGDWRSVDPSEVKWGAGVGVRYASPIGPVRLEVGWKLDRLPGEDAYVVLFSFGNPF